MFRSCCSPLRCPAAVLATGSRWLRMRLTARTTIPTAAPGVRTTPATIPTTTEKEATPTNTTTAAASDLRLTIIPTLHMASAGFYDEVLRHVGDQWNRINVHDSDCSDDGSNGNSRSSSSVNTSRSTCSSTPRRLVVLLEGILEDAAHAAADAAEWRAIYGNSALRARIQSLVLGDRSNNIIGNGNGSGIEEWNSSSSDSSGEGVVVSVSGIGLRGGAGAGGGGCTDNGGGGGDGACTDTSSGGCSGDGVHTTSTNSIGTRTSIITAAAEGLYTPETERLICEQELCLPYAEIAAYNHQQAKQLVREAASAAVARERAEEGGAGARGSDVEQSNSNDSISNNSAAAMLRKSSSSSSFLHLQDAYLKPLLAVVAGPALVPADATEEQLRTWAAETMTTSIGATMDERSRANAVEAPTPMTPPPPPPLYAALPPAVIKARREQLLAGRIWDLLLEQAATTTAAAATTPTPTIPTTKTMATTAPDRSGPAATAPTPAPLAAVVADEPLKKRGAAVVVAAAPLESLDAVIAEADAESTDGCAPVEVVVLYGHYHTDGILAALEQHRTAFNNTNKRSNNNENTKDRRKNDGCGGSGRTPMQDDDVPIVESTAAHRRYHMYRLYMSPPRVLKTVPYGVPSADLLRR